jgi:Kef-type K+ transport system membrane component KefB
VKAVAWFQLLVGAGIAALWPMLLLTGEVPEVTAGQVDIWFHIVAELGAALLLLVAGIAVLRRTARAHLLSALALGALAYTVVNSSGYYAETGDWAPVGMFGVILVATVAAFVRLLRDAHLAPVGKHPAGPADPAARRGETLTSAR